MHLLLSYIRPYRRLVVFAVILAVINQVFSLLDPQIFRIIIDKYAAGFGKMPWSEFIRGVSLMILAFVGVAMVSRIAKNFQDYYVNVVSQSVGANMYADGIAHSMRLPYRAFEEQQSGAVLQQLQKARLDSRDMIGQSINSVFISSLTLVLVLVYSFFVHWSIGVSLLILAPILGTLVSSLGRRIKRVQNRIFGETNALAGSTTESLRNIELIKSLGLETQEIDRLNATNQKILDLELAKVKTVRMLMFFQGTAINFFRALFLLQMLVLAYFKLITLGEFFSLMFYSFAIFSPLGEIGNVVAKYSETRASLENVERILAQEPAPRNPAGAVPDGIESLEFAGVTYKHPGAKDAALVDVSFAARSGESVAFVGPSGAGKSTLIKLLLGLYSPDHGRILFNGVDSAGINYDLLRTRVGFVPQSIELFAGTIRDNLKFVRQEATDDQCIASLEAAQLRGLLERSREGLDTRIGEGGLKLSGGERQRLAIARALLRKPDLLIFDEATSSLDTETEKEITRTIDGIIRTRPSFVTLLIAHRLSTVAGADRIVVLKKGKVVEQGSHFELLRKRGLYHTLWKQQGLERDEETRKVAVQGGEPRGDNMEKRALGATGLQVSVLGFGGFHLVEIPSADAARLLGSYLDNGGNYIETAAGYGEGRSESKIGAAVSHRRAQFVLATKSTERTRDGFLKSLDKSLRNLRTDHVDLMFMHAVQTEAEADAILGPGGALEGAEAARKAGKLRFVALSGHGRPDGLLHAVKLHRFDALMTVFNYLDRFNFPTVENELVPLCAHRGTGLIAMKAFGDGYLHKSPVPALRYALSMPVATVVAGINSDAMLKADLDMVAQFKPMTDAEKEEVYRSAPELGDYVCRLCGKCRTDEFDPQRVFLLEAVFDRQMDDMRVGDSAHYALRERLKQWFIQSEVARKEYAALKARVDPSKDYSRLSALCPYGIDVDRKLKIAHEKLSTDGYLA